MTMLEFMEKRLFRFSHTLLRNSAQPSRPAGGVGGSEREPLSILSGGSGSNCGLGGGG